MEGQTLFIQAFVYLAAAVVSVPIAKRAGLGAVLGYLLAGVVIGPFVLGLVGAEGEDVLHFSEFGVVMMLFLIGLELEPNRLWRLRGALLGLGGSQIVATAAVIAAAGLALGLDWRPALAIGLILSMSSTAIVLQSLTEKGLLRSAAGERSFAVLLFQDLAVIPLLALLPVLATQAPVAPAHEMTGMETMPTWLRAAVVLGAVAIIVLAGRYLVRPIFRFIAQSRVQEVFTAAALLIVVGIALLMQHVGLSPALGSFLGGVVLANSEYRHELESDIEPFKGLLLGLFFIAVGASIDFGLVGENLGTVTLIVCGLVVAKFLVLLALGGAVRMPLDQRLLFAFALAQGGEFCFVLFSFATQNGILDMATANILVGAVALSMALTPLLLVAHDRLVRPRFSVVRGTQREADVIDHRGTVILAGFGAFGSIVGRLLVANGIDTTVLDGDAEHVDVLRRLGLKVFYGDATRQDLLRAAGAERARLLVVSVSGAKALEIVALAREHFPHLSILARAHTREEAYELLDAGVENVYRESLDTALRLGVDAMHRLGFRAYQAQRAARIFRRHDEKAVRELAKMPHDGVEYLSRARQTIQELERLLLGEIESRDRRGDDAWDAESLREEYGQPPA